MKINCLLKYFQLFFPRYALDRGLVVIPKSVTPERIVQNFNVLDFKLDPEDLEKIASLECGGRFCDLKE